MRRVHGGEDDRPSGGDEQQRKQRRQDRLHMVMAMAAPSVVGVRPNARTLCPAMLSLLGMPLAIVFGAARGVGEHLMGLVDVLELQGRAGSRVVIGMVAPSQTAKRRVDFDGVSRGSNLQH